MEIIKQWGWQVSLAIVLTIFLIIRYRLFLLHKHQKQQLFIIVSTQEQERQRLAKDLHDDLGTSLSTLRLYIDGMSTLIEKQDEDLKQMHANALQILDSSIRNMREHLFQLNPSVLDEHGLPAAIDNYMFKMSRFNSLKFNLNSSHFPENITPEITINLYRIMQELVNNTIKYAQAKKISIQLLYRDNIVVFIYEDDGKGFDYEKIKTGYGLKNIATRIQMLNGSLSLDTKPGYGNNVMIELPFKSKYYGKEKNSNS